MALAACLLAMVGLVGVAAPASAAQARCNSYGGTYVNNIYAELPTYGGSVSCYLSKSSVWSTAVYQLQRTIELCYHYNLEWDGYYGAGTVEAVKYVQRTEGITADGTYGNQTRQSMKWVTGTSYEYDPGCRKIY